MARRPSPDRQACSSVIALCCSRKAYSVSAAVQVPAQPAIHSSEASTAAAAAPVAGGRLAALAGSREKRISPHTAAAGGAAAPLNVSHF